MLFPIHRPAVDNEVVDTTQRQSSSYQTADETRQARRSLSTWPKYVSIITQ